MQFTQVVSVAAVAAVASAQYANTTSTATVSHPSTTVITITSCEENKCHEVPVTTGVTVVTKTVDSQVTVYTTYCPLSEETTSTKYASSTKTVAPTATNATLTSQVIPTYTGAAAVAAPAVAAVAAGVALLL